MNRITRISIAVALVTILALTATGVWASREYRGTVPTPPESGTAKSGETVDMGTALFTPGEGATITVERVQPGDLPEPPEGKVLVGDIFKITAEPADALINVCYAYPPELAEKEAKIFRLNEEADPDVWVEVPGSEVKDGVICVSTTAGYVSLMGNP